MLLAGFDVGQSVAIAERACVAVEAMEGTDAMLRRAASLVNGRRMAMSEGRAPPGNTFSSTSRWWGLRPSPCLAETNTTVLAIEAVTCN